MNLVDYTDEELLKAVRFSRIANGPEHEWTKEIESEIADRISALGQEIESH